MKNPSRAERVRELQLQLASQRRALERVLAPAQPLPRHASTYPRSVIMGLLLAQPQLAARILQFASRLLGTRFAGALPGVIALARVFREVLMRRPA